MTVRPCAEPGCPALVTSGGRCTMHALRNGSTRQWRQTREQVINRDGARCHYCGGPATTVDHITPLAHGGTDDESNLAAACASCNYSKGAALT